MLSYLLAWTIRTSGLHFSVAKLVEMQRYALPIIPSAFGNFIQNFSDSLFLKHFADLATVGLYGLAYKFGMLLSEMAVQPFLRIWGVTRFELYEQDGAESMQRSSARVLTYYVLALAFAWLGLAAFSEDVLRI